MIIKNTQSIQQFHNMLKKFSMYFPNPPQYQEMHLNSSCSKQHLNRFAIEEDRQNPLKFMIY